jgi:excisionase family DNA binding protein
MSPLLTVRDAAAHLQVSVRTVWRLIACGDLVAYRLGRSVRIARSEFDGLLQRSRINIRGL